MLDRARSRTIDASALTFISHIDALMNDDKDQAMFTFTLLSILLTLPCTIMTCTIDDKVDRDFPTSPTSSAIPKNVSAAHAEVVYWELPQASRRRLLEHPRWTKQAYQGNDYSVVQRRHRQPRHRFDEGRSYRSAVKNDEDEDEDEEEEEDAELEEEEDDDDEDEKTDEGAEGNSENANEPEETVPAVAGSEYYGRAVRPGGYVPYAANVGWRRARRRQEAARIPSTSEECEEADESTEPSQYYEYETQVRNVAARDAAGCQAMLHVGMMLGAVLPILLVI